MLQILLLVPERAQVQECPRFFRFCVTKFQHMRRFVSYAHITNGLVAPLFDHDIFSFCITSFQQIDAVQGYIKEVRVSRLHMWDLIFPFVINYKFSFYYSYSYSIYYHHASSLFITKRKTKQKKSNAREHQTLMSPNQNYR